MAKVIKTTSKLYLRGRRAVLWLVLKPSMSLNGKLHVLGNKISSDDWLMILSEWSTAPVEGRNSFQSEDILHAFTTT